MAAGDNVIPFPKVGTAPPAPAMPELNEVIGSVLRDERERQDRTLSDVADQAAVSLPYLSEVERGRKEPSSPVLRSICDALEIPVPDLLEESARRLREISPSSSADFQLLAA